MKLALALSGQPRFIDDKRPRDFFYDNFIKKYDTDVFCHAWHTNRDSYYEKSPWSKNSHYMKTISSSSIENPIPKDSDIIILDYYKPKKYKFEPPKTFSFSSSCLTWMHKNFTNKHPEGYWSELGYSCILSHFKSIQEVLSLIHDPENYDFIVLSRYDITIPNFIEDLSILNKDMMHLQNIHNHFPDGIYIFSKKYFEWFKNLFDEIQTSKIFTRINRPETEDFKRASFQYNFGLEYIQPHPIRINILRK